MRSPKPGSSLSQYSTRPFGGAFSFSTAGCVNVIVGIVRDPQISVWRYLG
jgi:hypothetical protein